MLLLGIPQDQQLHGARGVWGLILAGKAPLPGPGGLTECQRGAVTVCGAAEQEACPLPRWEQHQGAGVGKPRFPPCAFHLSRVLSGECSTHLSSLNTRQPWGRATPVKPHTTWDGQCWVWGGFRCHNQNCSHPRREQLFPVSPALAVCGLSASPSR